MNKWFSVLLKLVSNINCFWVTCSVYWTHHCSFYKYFFLPISTSLISRPIIIITIKLSKIYEYYSFSSICLYFGGNFFAFFVAKHTNVKCSCVFPHLFIGIICSCCIKNCWLWISFGTISTRRAAINFSFIDCYKYKQINRNREDLSVKDNTGLCVSSNCRYESYRFYKNDFLFCFFSVITKDVQV